MIFAAPSRKFGPLGGLTGYSRPPDFGLDFLTTLVQGVSDLVNPKGAEQRNAATVAQSQATSQAQIAASQASAQALINAQESKETMVKWAIGGGVGLIGIFVAALLFASKRGGSTP